MPSAVRRARSHVAQNGAVVEEWQQDNWGDEADATLTAAVAKQVSAFALASGGKDAAFVKTLPPGIYTLVGSAADGVATGIVLVEVYVVP